jgi:C-terminal processing protease CtpA/Prc
MKLKINLLPLRRASLPVILAIFSLLAFIAPGSALAQAGSFERDRGHIMLDTIKQDIKKNYYDTSFHNMDLEARFKTAHEQIKQATTNGQILIIIAQTLVELNDSHTFLMPPPRPYTTEYGWEAVMVKDKCYVTAVKPGSDAEAKGLKPGDEIIAVDSRTLNRDTMWLFKYLYYSLRPMGGMHLAVQHPDGKQQEFDVMAKVKEGKRQLDFTNYNEIMNEVRKSEYADYLDRDRYYESANNDLIIWKMNEFDAAPEQVDSMMGKIRKYKSLILDLRGNPGGSVETLERLLGNFFDHDVKIADLKGRKEMKPAIAKTRGGDKVFKGQMIVLVDSRSASASEVLARVIQLEKRGTVIGDRSAGAVMRAQHFGHQVGVDTVVFYGVSVTDADLIMADGKSLEGVGVTPDEILCPTANDLASRRDPVLARAAELLGVKLDAEKAGQMFPVVWKK